MTNREATLERERRWAPLAAATALAAAPLYIVSIVVDQSSGVPTGGLDTERYRAIEANGAELLLAAGLRAIAFGLLCVPLIYLFRAAQARSPRVSAPMIGFCLIGPLLLAAQGIIAWVAQMQVADQFVADAAAGGDIYTLLEDLLDDSGTFAVASNLLFPAILGLIVAMVYIPLHSMRVGLLTRFFATLGMALGVGTLFIIPAVSLLTITLWFGWLGLLILGRTPKPRPPAWDLGEARPWPRPGEEPAEPAAAQPEPPLASEPEAPPADRPQRRERARKRKRKRKRRR